MAVRLSGTFKKFEGGLKASVGSVPWQEDDATFAIDYQGVELTSSPNVSLSSVTLEAEASPFAASSISAIQMVRSTRALFHHDDNWTVDGWFKMADTNSGNFWMLWDAPPNYYDRLHMGQESGNFRLWNNTTNPVLTWSGQAWSGVWKHYSCVHDAANQTLTVYINGVNVGSRSRNLPSSTNGLHYAAWGAGIKCDRFQIVPRILRTGNFDPNTIYN